MQSTVNQKIVEFIDYYKAEIYRLPLDKALEQAEQLGLLLRANEVGIYSLNELETFLIEKFYSELSINYDVVDNDRHNKIIFIATELYHTGGHTRLMERLASFLDTRPDLLITKKTIESIIKREEGFFSSIHHGCADGCTVGEKVSFFLNVILQYNIVILNIHPEDIYAIVACGLARKVKKDIKIYFVNHADHTFSYGSSISDVWFEISGYGVTVDAMRGLKARKCFLGIPIDTSNKNSENSYKFENGDLILSAASPSKYEPTNQQSIMPLVSALLDKYDKSNIKIIGVNFLTNYWWWAIKLRYWNRLKLSKSLPYEEYIKVTSSAKLYIDSHPFPGGTAFAEQFLLGRMCVGLNSVYNGYTPVEYFKKDSVDSVLREIELINNKKFIDIKNEIEMKHGFTSVRVRFLDAIFKDVYAKENFILSFPKVKNSFEKIPVKIDLVSKIRPISTKKAFCLFYTKKIIFNIFFGFRHCKFLKKIN
ncbi:hypothetical protein [Aeromonas hydrophila]|uniref:hypothetical protein n=1 Tax=Aeromonas hydrophila TaxID=644 RepID=UPI0039877ECC